jgi:hypothetical protein
MTEDKQTIPARSWQSVKIYNRIVQMEPGELLSFDDLSELIGKDVRAVRWLLQSARNRALRHDGIVTSAVHGTGIRRVTGEGKVNEAGERLKRLRRGARRAALINRSMGAEEWTEMSEGARVRAVAQQAQLAAIEATTARKQVKELEAKATNERQFELPEWVGTAGKET